MNMMNLIYEKINVVRHSFKIRLFLAITGMTILFIAISGYFSYLLGRNSIEKQIEQYAIGTVKQIRERVHTYLSQPVKTVSLLKAALENGFVNPSDPGELIRYFHILRDEHPEYININYGDRDGRFTMVPPQRPEIHKLFDPRIRPWYAGALQHGGLYWTEVYVFASSQNPGITVSAPILNKEQSVTGVCSIDIDLSTFSRFLKTMKIGGQGHAYIVDNDQNRVIAHPELLSLHINPDQGRLLSAGLADLKSRGKYFGLMLYQGKQYFTAYSDYPENNWSVGVNLPVSDFLEDINTIKETTFTMVLVAVFISTLVSYLVALTVIKPLRVLEQGIKRVSAGDLDYMVNLHDPNIVGTLAEAYNQMAYSLRHSREELKRTYFELAEKEKMAAIGLLTAGIAHEIKNPLGIILGSAQVVTNPDKPDEMRAKAARFIIDEVIRLNKTLKAFLAFARPEPPRLAKINLNMVLDETLDIIAVSLAPKKIRLEKYLSVPVPDCKADLNQLRQIFLNILLNAIQAMADGGVLTVKTALKSENGDVGGGQNKPGSPWHADSRQSVVISISDTGIGITPDQLEKIFEPFVTFRDDGTGLGLSIVAQSLKLHHATIMATNNTGDGSTFTIHFPLEKEKTHAP